MLYKNIKLLGFLLLTTSYLLLTTNVFAQSSGITIPDYGNFPGFPSLRPEFKDLGSLISAFLNLAFIIASFLSFFWLIWGAFEYLFSGGDKQRLGKARARITWAIVGLLILSVSFLLSQYVEQILKPRKPSPISLVQTAYAAEPINIGQAYDFGHVNTLADGVALLVVPAFSIAAIGVVFYFLFAAFKIITAAGNKDAITSAQQMITHAVIGFVLLMLSFVILQFVPQFFGISFRVIQ